MTARYHPRRRSSRQCVFLALLLPALASLFALAPSASAALPDARAYELLSPLEENATAPYAAVPSLSGEAVDFQARGAFAGASTGSLNLYQATRTPAGWQTAPLTPTPTSPLGSLEEQVPLFYSPDSSQTIFTTPESYAPGDTDGGALDLYLRSPGGALTWVSQGPQGGGAPDEVTFDGATPDAGSVVFSTAEPLLAAATPLEAGNTPEAEYLYERAVGSGQTQLVDVDETGALLGSAATELTAPVASGGAELTVASTAGFRDDESVTLGSGAAAEAVRVERVVGQTLVLAPDGRPQSPHGEGEPVTGRSAGAILGDGTSLTTGPPPVYQYLPADVTGTTTHAISTDGGRVFFESPSPDAHRTVSLYMREGSRTVLIAQGPLDPTFPVEASEQPRFEGASETGSVVFYTSLHGLYAYETETAATTTVAPSVLGVTAIADDGSRLFFASDSVLAANPNSQGASAIEGDPNLYAYDTATQATTFIATVAASDVEGEGYGPTGLVAEPDVDRPAVPTPDGSVLVFAAHGNLTGQNPAERFTEIYRYSVAEEQLVCVSCTRTGVEPTGDASFGETAGGTYDPASLTSPMNASGSEIFFQTPDSLVGEDTNHNAPVDPVTGHAGSTDVYEWQGGGVHLISCGCSATPSTLMGTTPSGDDVLFTTAATLVRSESAGGYVALYDARVGGGFPPPPSDGELSCVSGCRAASPEPPLLATPPDGDLPGPWQPARPESQAEAEAVGLQEGLRQAAREDRQAQDEDGVREEEARPHLSPSPRHTPLGRPPPLAVHQPPAHAASRGGGTQCIRGWRGGLIPVHEREGGGGSGGPAPLVSSASLMGRLLRARLAWRCTYMSNGKRCKLRAGHFETHQFDV